MSRIRKIKYNPNKGEFLITLEEGSLFGEGKIEYSCKKEPHPDFVNTLQDFKGFVNEFCELGITKEGLKENLIITGICIDYQENKEGEDFMGFILIAQRKLGDKILNITTPRSTTAISDCPNMKASIDKILEEAFAYMKGKEVPSPQADLFEEPSREEMKEAITIAGEILQDAGEKFAKSMSNLAQSGISVSIQYEGEEPVMLSRASN